MTERDAIIQDIYKAMALPDCWPALLKGISRTAGTTRIVLLTRRSDAWSGYAISKPMEHDC